MLRTISCLAVLLAIGNLRADDTLFRDDFRTDNGRYELSAGKTWRIADGALHFKAQAGDAYAVANIDEREQFHVEADTCPARRLSAGYPLAGLTVFLDRENHWRLLLVASPSGKQYFELSERRNGVHHAQSVAGPTRLSAKQEGDLREWQYGQKYHLTLALSESSITGEIRDAASGRFWRCRYALTTGHAVRAGRPGLWASGLEGTFQGLVVQAPPLPAAALFSLAHGAAGSVAIIEDEGRRVARPLAALLQQNKYGVTIVSWADLVGKRLPTEALDVLILADARRAPAHVAQLVTRFLRAQGRLIAVGAPAFGELLCRLGTHYVPAERFAEELYPLLDKRPLVLDAKKWKRGCQNSKRSGTIEAVAAEQAGEASPALPMPIQAWKITTDLQGWDVFSQPASNAMAEGRTLLCFQARGDDHTPQLAVECIDRDGARWMATVELSMRVQSYVLRPVDFTFWRDSKAKRDPGQRMNPAQIERIIFGLSASHTPRCKPGSHALVVQGIATAVDPHAEEPEVHVPEIEGLCPSYKLYPLERVPPTDKFSLHELYAESMYPLLAPEGVAGYAPVSRPGGLGFDRARAVRLVRFIEAYDSHGQDHGSPVWLMLGDRTWPGAVWAGVGLADPVVLARSAEAAGDGRKDDARLAQSFLRLVQRMTKGVFLLEAGSRQFSYYRDEPIELGATVVNAGRAEQMVDVGLTVSNGGHELTRRTATLAIPSHQRRQATWEWRPKATDWEAMPVVVSTDIKVAADAGKTSGAAMPAPLPSGSPCERIAHSIDILPEGAARRDEFVTVDGSRFVQGGKAWYAKGINYWPNAQGGLATVHRFQRDQYDPAIVERDLDWMQRQGLNFLSGIQAPQFDKEDGPAAYRDLHDFLNRCRNHHMKVFYFLQGCNPLLGGTAARAIEQINAAGIKNHPAILAWELSWEPIYYAGPRNGAMDFLVPDWNTWIIEQFGSLQTAEDQWGIQLPRLEAATAVSGKEAAQRPSKSVGPVRRESPDPAVSVAARVGLPPYEWFQEHGRWDRATAAFRRFFSDRVGRAYGEMIRPLRAYDPNHLISFRFGACGIPNKAWFAHAHSAGVARHVDLLCPEGYNLQKAQGTPTPPDEIRKGGLTTLYYRFLGREKPVVWMEFGYTVNGMHTPWKNEMVKIDPAQLAAQRREFESFYQMFIESGAQGAAPWWLPGGFRLDEQSDFGVLEPDGSPRPACGVIRDFLPRFERPIARCVPPTDPAARAATRPVINLDFDTHYADAWDTWAPQYLEAVAAGKLPYVATAGTHTTSADCPLTAVGGMPWNGSGPLQFLNAEFDAVEVQEIANGPWRPIGPGETLAVKSGDAVKCRVSLGNTGEAAWLAGSLSQEGRVLLLCSGGLAASRHMGIVSDTPYLADTQSAEFEIPASLEPHQTVILQLVVHRQTRDGRPLPIPFGPKWRLTIRRIP